MSTTELEILEENCGCGCKSEKGEPMRTVETGCGCVSELVEASEKVETGYGCESATPGSKPFEAAAAVKDNGCDNPKCTCDPCTCPPPCRCGEN